MDSQEIMQRVSTQVMKSTSGFYQNCEMAQTHETLPRISAASDNFDHECIFKPELPFPFKIRRNKHGPHYSSSVLVSIDNDEKRHEGTKRENDEFKSSVVEPVESMRVACLEGPEVKRFCTSRLSPSELRKKVPVHAATSQESLSRSSPAKHQQYSSIKSTVTRQGKPPGRKDSSEAL